MEFPLNSPNDTVPGWETKSEIVLPSWLPQKDKWTEFRCQLSLFTIHLLAGIIGEADANLSRTRAQLAPPQAVNP
jgi:hypothetical protein